MSTSSSVKDRTRIRPVVGVLIFLLTGLPAGAVSYVSVEPIPSGDVVGGNVLANLLGLDGDVQQRWAELLANCGLVEGVLDTLAADGTVTTLNGANTIVSEAAGGFEGSTAPTYVLTIVDSNLNAVSTADLETVANALSYVFSQGSAAYFSGDDPAFYDFSLDYVTVTFESGPPSLVEAQSFFEHVGTVDEALYTGSLAGYTQVGAMLVFLQPATDTSRFVAGMSAAATTYPGVIYGPFDTNGHATTATAGVVFPSNDWVVNPAGNGYLDHVAQAPDADLGKVPNLSDWRRLHRRAVRVLNRQIVNGIFEVRGVRALERVFNCP